MGTAMKDDVKVVLERNVKAVTMKPALGRGTSITRVRLREGLACDVEDGPWKLIVGMSEKYGGTAEGPNPGVFGRAALGSCLALGYAMWAARLQVPIDSLQIEVQADFDVRGELGAADDVRPGYLAMRYIVTVASPAPIDTIHRWLDIADKYSSWRDNLLNPVPVVSERRIQTTAAL